MLTVVVVYFGYGLVENGYQRNMDPIRRKHVSLIVGIIQEYANKTGHLPFQAEAADKPLMVLIGHSPREEAYFANDPVLERGAAWTNASNLEAVLSKELGRSVRLPRDPQKVPTFAPNVYIYFVSGNQMTVACHLKFPTDETVEYEWHGHPLYSYTIAYEFNPKR